MKLNSNLINNIINTNPLEQFEVVSGLHIALILIIVTLVSMYFISLVDHKVSSVASLINTIVMQLVASLQRENLAMARQYFFMPTLYVFLFILISNLSGLSPFSFTPTSSFIVTFFLSSAFFIAINLIGTFNLRWDMANLFLPSGTPLAITSSLAVIELISYIARVFSLAIRLFANMMSGHALLKILIGFSFTMLASGSLAIVATIPWAIVCVILVLEMLIAFLQAYVFVVLLTLYTADILFKH